MADVKAGVPRLAGVLRVPLGKVLAAGVPHPPAPRVLNLAGSLQPAPCRDRGDRICSIPLPSNDHNNQVQRQVN